jgi:hypothetical protein
MGIQYFIVWYFLLIMSLIIEMTFLISLLIYKDGLNFTTNSMQYGLEYEIRSDR